MQMRDFSVLPSRLGHVFGLPLPASRRCRTRSSHRRAITDRTGSTVLPCGALYVESPVERTQCWLTYHHRFIASRGASGTQTERIEAHDRPSLEALMDVAIFASLRISTLWRFDEIFPFRWTEVRHRAVGTGFERLDELLNPWQYILH